MNDTDYKITVIVPVYNVDKYLENCVSSIINQTYRNIEILLVDDGSTDQSGQLCDRFKDSDSRVRVIHKENGGLSSARNAGLDEMSGDYVTFVDSDDWLTNDMLECQLSEALQYNVDIVHSNCFSVYNGKVHPICVQPKKYLSTKKDILTARICSGGFCLGRWPCLFKASMFDDVRFQVGMTCSEDSAMDSDILLRVNTVYCDGVPRYYYRSFRNGSLANSEIKESDLLAVDYVGNNVTQIQKMCPEVGA